MRAVLRETFLKAWSVTDGRLKPDAGMPLTFYEADGTTPLTTPIYANKTGSTVATRATDSTGGFTGYSDIGKPVVAVLEGVPIMSGFVRYGDGYVNPMDFGATGDGTTNDYASFALAVAYAISTNRRLWVPEGTFNFLSTLVIPSLLWMAGDGPGTIFRHGDNSPNPVLQIAGGAVRNILENFRVDGNYAANHDAITGFTSDEVFFGGSYGTYRDIEIFNNNGTGADVSGSYNHYSNIRAIGPNVAIASYASSATQNMGGLYGLQCSGTSTSVGNYWENLYATAYRSAGVYIGGQYCRAVGPKVDNCHRQYFPDSPPTGGGQFAVSSPTGGTQQLEIIGLQVGPAAVGSPSTAGAEIGAGTFVTLVDPQIIGQTNHGITAVNVSELHIIGGVVNGVGNGLVMDSVAGGVVQGLQTQSCGVGVVITGTTDYVDFRGVGFSANTTNFSDTTSPQSTHNTGGGWRMRNGTLPTLPNELVTYGQIVFPATENPSSNANTLDDYEESTWVPTLASATTTTYTTQTGNYIKIGRQVTVWCTLVINSRGNGSQSTIAGLPFQADLTASGVVGYWASANTTFTTLTATVNTGTSTVTLSGATVATADLASPINVFKDGTTVQFTVTYRTAS